MQPGKIHLRNLALPALALFLLACSLGAPAVPPSTTPPPSPTLESTSVPASPTPAPPQPTLSPQPSLTRLPALTLRPTAAPTLTPSRFPTLFSRASEIAGKTCPFNIPVKVVAPALEPGGYAWQAAITPNGDACITKIKIAPGDGRTWYIGGQSALYITRDDGRIWERSLAGQVGALALDPRNPNRVLAGFQVARTLYESLDQGRTWRLLKTFETGIMSLLVSASGAIIVGPHWSSSQTPNGVYLSSDNGVTWQHSPFGTSQRGLILWDLAESPLDQTLYTGTEIYNHPQPYKPPFFRSRDGGKTWEEIGGSLPWHVIAIQVAPGDGSVFALTEGAGLYRSADRGDHWQRLANGPTMSLALDPRQPARLFGGAQFSPQHRLEGGIYASGDGGRSFFPVGLLGVTVGGIAFSPDGRTLYTTAYASGIYRVTLPE